MVGITGPRAVWVAASTHAGEEALALLAHSSSPGNSPICSRCWRRAMPPGATRSPLSRGSPVLAAAQRSRGEPLERGTQVYVADTMGEMGLFYRLSSVIFVGKSLAGRGGQNPIEPAKLGSAILHGPHVGNFVDAYAALDQAGGAIEVADASELAGRLGLLFADPD